MLTKGEYRVGIGFNPSGDDVVAQIKRAAAELIDMIETIPVDAEERIRLKELAQDAIEDGAMWAVKAATKQPADVAPSEGTGRLKSRPDEDPFKAIVRDAIREFRALPLSMTKMGAIEFVRAALKKQGFLSVSGDDIDEAIIEVDVVA